VGFEQAVSLHDGSQVLKGFTPDEEDYRTRLLCRNLGGQYVSVAPEQLATDGICTEATDIWSFGETLYYCLIAAAPFPRPPYPSRKPYPEPDELKDYVVQCQNRIKSQKGLEKPIKIDSRRWCDLSKEAGDLIERCLKALPDDRFKSVTEVLKHEWWEPLCDPEYDKPDGKAVSPVYHMPS